MNALQSMRGPRATIAIALAASLLLFFAIVRPQFASLEAAESRLAELDRLLLADRAAVASLRAYPALRARYQRLLGSVDVRSSDATLTADFLRTFLRTSAPHNVIVVSLVANATRSNGATKATRMRELELRVTLEGRYAAVIASLESLSHAREIVRVESLELTRIAAKNTDRTVHAVLTLRLLRLDGDPLRVDVPPNRGSAHDA